MSADDDMAMAGRDQPTAQIHQAHVRALRARQNYVSVSMSQAADDMLQHAHHELNRSVLRYLEAMKYLLRTKSVLRPYWDGKPPSDVGAPFEDGKAFLFVTEYRDELDATYLTTLKEVLQTTTDGGRVTPDDIREYYREQQNLRPVDRIEFTTLPDDDVVYRVRVQAPRYGLYRIADQWQRRQQVEEQTTGLLGARRATRDQPEYLPSEVLIRAGTALDEAADELNLLADVKSSRQRFHADDDTNEHPDPHGTAAPPK